MAHHSNLGMIPFSIIPISIIPNSGIAAKSTRINDFP